MQEIQFPHVRRKHAWWIAICSPNGVEVPVYFCVICYRVNPMKYRENNVCTQVTNCFSAHERVILVFISRVAKLTQKQFFTRMHTLFYFLHNIMNKKMTIKTMIFTHHPRVSLARFLFCWWRHNRLLMTSQWPNNCGAMTWIVISVVRYRFYSLRSSRPVV